MFELNVKYNTKALAEKMGVGYQTLRKYRNKYEEHLKLFYDFNITMKGSTIYYEFVEKIADFVPYVEYQRNKKSAIIKAKVEKVIQQDGRQTGSNVARIICVDDDIQAFNWELSTLTVYTREELKALVDSGEYIRDDYRWCYLDKATNKYVLMSDEEVAELRQNFSTFKNEEIEVEENAWSQYKQKIITKQQLITALGEMRLNCYASGVDKFAQEHGVWPIKVPTYVAARQF